MRRRVSVCRRSSRRPQPCAAAHRCERPECGRSSSASRHSGACRSHHLAFRFPSGRERRHRPRALPRPLRTSHEFDLVPEHGYQASFDNDCDQSWEGGRRCRRRPSTLPGLPAQPLSGADRRMRLPVQVQMWFHAPTHGPPRSHFSGPGEAAPGRPDRASRIDARLAATRKRAGSWSIPG